jgi:cell division protein FtsW
MVRRSLKKKKVNDQGGVDRIFLFLVSVLCFLGIIMLASAGSAKGFAEFGDGHYFVKRQILNGIIPGFLGMWVLSKIDYRHWKKFALPMLITSILLLVAVFIPGIGAEFGTARSWIDMRFFAFQPSEIVKLTLLLYLAAWFEKQGKENIASWSQGFLPFVFILGVISFLILMQPDMGTLLIIVGQVIAVFFIAGGALSHLALLGTGGLSLLYLMIKISPYRAARLSVFLHPELDPQGIGYHINQAFMAIGSGGLWGRGYGHSRQKFQYLPEVIGDSIFAVISEEMGFFFATLIIGLFAGLFWRGLYIARRAPDIFGQIIGIGVVTWIMLQMVVNIGAMVGLLPLTGVPLPFISSGGTSLAITLAAIGIVLNISKHQKHA